MARKSVVEAGGAIGIDTSDLKLLAVRLRTAGRAAQLEFKAGMAEAAEVIVEEAKARAGAHSSTIPATIKPRITGVSAEVRAGADGKPLARLFETGNLRKGRVQPTADTGRQFRHPVFGNREVWVNQSTHPFLYPAVLFSIAKVRTLLIEVFRTALREQEIETE